MRVLGCDISINGPGFAVLEDKNPLLITSQSLSDYQGPERLELIYENFKKIVQTFEPNIICFEGYGYASFTLSLSSEIGGILRFYAYRSNIHYYEIPPSTLKKFFTGHGASPKHKMMVAAKERAFVCRNNDEADAVALACYGLEGDLDKIKRKWVGSRQNRLGI